jgi:mono/diheme cytochrome c family protein
MGGRVYDKNCASCHGADLGGREAKPGQPAAPSIAAGSTTAQLDPAEALAPIADPEPRGPHADLGVTLGQRRYLQAYLADRWRGGALR